MTPRERDLLDFIRRFVAENAVAPSYDAMQQGLGLRSKGRIHDMVAALVDEGALVKSGRTGRRVRIELPERPNLAAVPTQYLLAELERRGPCEPAEGWACE